MSVLSTETKRVTELSAITKAEGSYKIPIHDGNGLKQITLEDMMSGIYFNAGSHNRFRGKYLGDWGNSPSGDDAAVIDAINSGTFEGVFVGDCFHKTIGGTKYLLRFAHADKDLHKGDTQLTRHSMVVVPDGTMGSSAMNATNATDGGYIGCDAYQNALNTLRANLATAFGDHLISRRVLLPNAVSAGKSTGWAWYGATNPADHSIVAGTVDLMTEEEVYGHLAWHHDVDPSGYDIGIDYGQLALFAQAPEFICNRANWWLRSVGSAAYFCIVGGGGDASYGGASNVYGLRPRFLIG